MLRSRRGKPVYLVYDEDTFLAAPNGGLAAAFTTAPRRAGRPPVHRRRWTRALIVTLAAATTAQLVASRTSHHRESPSSPSGGHARTARSPVPTGERARRQVGASLTSPSVSPAGRDRARTVHHRYARRARQASRPGPPTRLAGLADQPPIPAARPVPAPRPQPAPTHRGPTGTRAAHEFGFED
jgi:hypothetical protein